MLNKGGGARGGREKEGGGAGSCLRYSCCESDT